MNAEQIILQILKEYQFGDNLKNGDYVTGVKKMYFHQIAKDIVKKLNIDSVDSRRELLCNCSFSESEIDVVDSDVVCKTCDKNYVA